MYGTACGYIKPYYNLKQVEDMKHFLVLSGFEFYMTEGVKQSDNVEVIFKRIDSKNIRAIMRDADCTRAKMRKSLRTNPVLSKLLSKILLVGSGKLSTA